MATQQLERTAQDTPPQDTPPPPRILDVAPMLVATTQADPYPYFSAAGCIRPDRLPDLRRDFPDLREAGYHPLDSFAATGSFSELLADIASPALAAAMTRRFGIDFAQYPQFVTVRKLSRAHEGNIHTDSDSKIATMLIYLNSGWQSPEGHIRVLRGKSSFADFAAEVAPDEGNVFAFLRGPQSWHGHTPFTGERRVVQIAWLRDAADLERKQRSHGLSRFFKKLWGG